MRPLNISPRIKPAIYELEPNAAQLCMSGRKARDFKEAKGFLDTNTFATDSPYPDALKADMYRLLQYDKIFAAQQTDTDKAQRNEHAHTHGGLSRHKRAFYRNFLYRSGRFMNRFILHFGHPKVPAAFLHKLPPVRVRELR